GALTDGTRISLRAHDGTHYVSAAQDPLDARATAAAANEYFTVKVISRPFKARHGIVRADHRTIVDDDGAFYPLGATMMWSLWGWKNDRDRLKQNLDFLKRHHWDYVRILGEVDWAGEEIDPNWPDYP